MGKEYLNTTGAHVHREDSAIKELTYWQLWESFCRQSQGFREYIRFRFDGELRQANLSSVHFEFAKGATSRVSVLMADKLHIDADGGISTGDAVTVAFGELGYQGDEIPVHPSEVLERAKMREQKRKR